LQSQIEGLKSENLSLTTQNANAVKLEIVEEKVKKSDVGV